TLSAGNHTITAKAVDAAGNIGAASTAYALTIDTAAPGAPTGLSLDPSTDSGTVGDGVTNFSQAKIDGTAEASSTVTLYDSNGTTVLGTGVANATTGSFSITTSTLSSGNHTITAKATDAAGNVSAASAGYSVTINNTGPSAPTGLALDTTTDSGVAGDAITNITQAKIDGIAGAGTTVTLYDSNGTTVLGTGVADATTGAFGITTFALSNGTHNITAKATDSAGNISAASTAYALTIDTTAPASPTGLSLDPSTDSGTVGDGITNFSQVKIDGTAEAGSTVTLYDSNGTTVLGAGVANATTGAFGITTSTLSA
ncbi:Ig-like domain-containing protein, partial [Labrys miyagiensis]|uniref:Ig-like domain-containing protein n=1 Tax=Labrys miyagiensis TaxID=346912 RepID=UPI0024E10BD0